MQNPKWLYMNFNYILYFGCYFCTSVYFKTLVKKTPVHSEKIPEEIFPNLYGSCWKTGFEF
jgi:hypothetical protein